MSPPHKPSVPTPLPVQKSFDTAANRTVSLPQFRRWRSLSHQKSDVFIMRSLSINGIKETDSKSTLWDVQTDEEEVLKEEAICRICMMELDEGNETFRMECCCKGELALAHKDCAMKWFSLKGNNFCDVCKCKVNNLPVLLFRRTTSLARNTSSASRNLGDIDANGSWARSAVLHLSSALTLLWHKLQDLSEFP